MSKNEHPFLITKPDNEVQEIFSTSTIYRSKLMSKNGALHYLYTALQCSPISVDDTLTFLQKQFKSKFISSKITISKADCDKLILSQLGTGDKGNILLVKRKYFLKNIIIAFERVYLIPTETEYTLL